MKFDKHGNGNGFDDLYVLPENEKEKEAILSFLRERKFYFEWSFSNVEGQEWYGKSFIEIPFMEYLEKELAAL